jgi:hypothetical protein
MNEAPHKDVWCCVGTSRALYCRPLPVLSASRPGTTKLAAARSHVLLLLICQHQLRRCLGPHSQ